MAIKFRCKHCQQFLGISLARAGQVVDCPNCGRTIRVPDLDGRVRPLPSPQLDLEDSGLVKALREVSKIGAPPSTETMDIRSATPSEAAIEVIEPVPLPEPPPLDPPEPITFAPQPKAVTIDEAEPAPQLDNERDIIAELAQLAGERNYNTRRSSASEHAFAQSLKQLAAPAPLIAILTLMALALGIGVWIGHLTANEPATPLAADGSIAADGQANDAGTNAGAKSDSLRGRITFKSQSGDSSADSGAKVIVFPIQETGNARLPANGFRAAATPAEIQAAADAIRKLGGDLAVVDEAGNFDLKLPAPGTYPILVLARSQNRDTQKALEPNLKQLLENYFEKPESVLGELRYHFSRIHYRGTGSEIWDYSFEGE